MIIKKKYYVKVKDVQSFKVTKPQKVFLYPSHLQKMHKITVSFSNSDVKTKMEISSNFCGLLRIHELYRYVKFDFMGP